MELASQIYSLTAQFPKEELYGLTLQTRRSAISIPSNIAEGAARNSKKEFIHFLHVALGSIAELETQLLLARNIGFLSETSPFDRIDKVRMMLDGLIRFIKKKPLTDHAYRITSHHRGRYLPQRHQAPRALDQERAQDETRCVDADARHGRIRSCSQSESHIRERWAHRSADRRKQPNGEKVVNEKVYNAARRLQELGAKVDEVSLPMHTVGPAIWTPIGVEGLTQTMMWGDGYGLSRSDLYSVSLMDFHRNWRHRANELSETTKLFLMLGTYILNQHGSRYYGKAMNIARRLTAAYDRVLTDHDLLLMPTTPMKATPLPGRQASREEYIQRALEMIGNTAPFDVTHHPAMSVPCGMVDGLPVGMMLVGKHFDEPTIYRAAQAFEKSGDWKKM